LDFYGTIPPYSLKKSSPAGEMKQSKGGLKQKIKQILDLKQLKHKFGAWGYALGVSLFPFFIIFAGFTGPPKNFAILEFFRDYAFFYLCVTMSALSLYMYRKVNWIACLHGFLMLTGMAFYILLTNGVSIPLVDVVSDHRLIVLCFFLFSLVLSILTLILSSVKKGEKT